MNTRYLSVTIAVLGLTLAAFAAPALGQEYHWTWMKGSDVRRQPGEYGEIGVPAEGNTPGARDGTVSWTDDDGCLWLFGGWGFDGEGDWNKLNDLWRLHLHVPPEPTPPPPPMPTPVPVTGGIWYLPAGGTQVGGEAFDTYILISNPVYAHAEVEVRYVGTDQEYGTVHQRVKERTRHTENMADTVGAGQENVAAIVRSTNDVPIIVERAMYFPSGPANWTGSHNTIGLDTVGTDWFLAEGATHIFNQYVLVANPSETETASVDFTFTDQHGNIWTAARTVPPQRRETVNVNDVAGSVTQISTVVESDIPVVAERAMYWPKGGPWNGGHSSLGVGE